MEQLAIRGLRVLLAIAAAALVVALLWGVLGFAGLMAVFLVDALTLADVRPQVAPLLWAIWGIVFGTCIGLHITAADFGWERRRPVLIAAPLCLMLLIAALGHL